MIPKHASYLRSATSLGLCFWLGAVACNKKTDQPADPVETGRGLYAVHCTACHNPVNPGLDGSVGPAIRGSSLELLQARILRTEYPPNYPPKRATHLMPRLPLTDPDIEALHAFLNAPPPP